MAYPGDEFYLKAERPLPPAGFYEDFSMLENGVGLLPLLMDEFYSALKEAGEIGGSETRNHHCHGNGAEGIYSRLFG